MIQRIHVMGAPGSGISTLGRQLAERLGYPHFDADDFHWFTDDPEPYRRRRNPEHRRRLMEAVLHPEKNWVLTGSVCDWGDIFAPRFEALVFGWAPAEVRMARIQERERLRYGPERLSEGGDLNGVFIKFLNWAAAYDAPDGRSRTRAYELDWMARHCLCPQLELDMQPGTAYLLDRVLEWLRELDPGKKDNTL